MHLVRDASADLTYPLGNLPGPASLWERTIESRSLASRQEGATAEKAVPFSKLRLSIVIQQAPDEHLCDAALMACQAAIVSDPVLLRLSFTAGASGFLNLTSRATGPTGSGTPHPLQYNPSRPSLQACWNTTAPSGCSRCSLATSLPAEPAGFV